ncbi:MAG TPA: hypothetical protein DHV48_08120 [Prolixibacteraceae bacterium]|nr:MAG: hypothetical protein A2066_05420 [Bacteroidetes bacterium GWB2_41_8]HCY41305.1 hypothetical protein [Prolixibacteraceae bacterium]
MKNTFTIFLNKFKKLIIQLLKSLMDKTSVIKISSTSEEIKKKPKMKLEYEVTNLIVAREKCLKVVWKINN